jgi:hypothetical protein
MSHIKAKNKKLKHKQQYNSDKRKKGGFRPTRR